MQIRSCVVFFWVYGDTTVPIIENVYSAKKTTRVKQTQCLYIRYKCVLINLLNWFDQGTPLMLGLCSCMTMATIHHYFYRLFIIFFLKISFYYRGLGRLNRESTTSPIAKNGAEVRKCIWRLSRASVKVQDGPKSKPLPNDQNPIKAYKSLSVRYRFIRQIKVWIKHYNIICWY